MVSVNVNSKEFLQSESAESKELQDRVSQLTLRWNTALGVVESWREGLRQSLMQCQVRRLSTQPVPKASSGAQPGPRQRTPRGRALPRFLTHVAFVALASLIRAKCGQISFSLVAGEPPVGHGSGQ